MKDKQYKFKADEFIKIWFSKNQDVFLPIVNQVRFINFMLDHPGSAFHFIYKASVLADNAREELLSFCEKFGVIPIDFDNVETTSKIDKQLKQQINIEIENSINNKGGDLGAASDMARLMPNIIKLGFYLDFDTKATFPQKLYMAKTPLLADIKVRLTPEGGLSASTNNQFIAVAKQNNGEINKNAAKILKDLSKIILNKYNSFKEIKTNSIDQKTWDTLSNIFYKNLSYTSQDVISGEANTDDMLMKYILTQYFESSYSKIPSIVSLRHFVKETLKKVNLIDNIKQFIYSETMSYGFDSEGMKDMLKDYDLTTEVIYNPLVMSITGPGPLSSYMVTKSLKQFILDPELSSAISSQIDKIEIEPGKSIDRDGDISWFNEQEPNKPFLGENRTKIFEIEELQALEGRLSKMKDTDPFFNVLQEYLSLGCKAIEGGFTGVCKKLDTVNIVENDSISISGDSDNQPTNSDFNYAQIICDYTGLLCNSSAQDL